METINQPAQIADDSQTTQRLLDIIRETRNINLFEINADEGAC